MRHYIHRQQAYTLISDHMKKFDATNIDDLKLNGFEGKTREELIEDWVKYQYGASTNLFLAELCEFISGTDYRKYVVTGEAEKYEKCPCCGYRTLTEPNEYDICHWCDWEDFGLVEDNDVYYSINRGSITDYRKKLKSDQRCEKSIFHRWLG